VFDGKSSLSIANIVAQSWRMQDDFYTFQWREKQSKEELERRQEASSGKIMATAQENSRMLSMSSKYTRDYIKQLALTRQEMTKTMDTAYVAEQASEVAAQTVARQTTALNSIFEFQSAILTYFMERKFQQAQITSMFYKNMFRGSRQDLQVGKEKMTELFGLTNYVPQISMFETMSNDARKDVQDGMKSVEYLYSSGQLYAALERLMETFVLGEYEPILQTFDTQKKATLLQIYKKTSTIKKLVDAKDWGGIEDIVKELSKLANDYPSVEILANIKSAQRASNILVLSAKQAASIGRIEDVKTALEKAAKIWPLNPAIETFNNELVGLTQGSSKYLQKFDELYDRQNYRDIVAEATEYGMALRQDTERAKKLKDIVINISQIDSMIAQADELRKQRNPYLAWDILENARALDANDPMLARAIASLAPEVSDYVRMLNKASEAEKRREYAIALNYYLAAQEIFPASQSCRLGIERVASKYIN